MNGVWSEASCSMYRGAERVLVVGLFGNIRSMTPLLVVSASQDFSGSRAENMACNLSSQLFSSVETVVLTLFIKSDPSTFHNVSSTSHI